MTTRRGHIGYLLAVWELHFIGRDYLGSITHVADSEGNLVAEYRSFTAAARSRSLCCGTASQVTSGCRGSGFTT